GGRPISIALAPYPQYTHSATDLGAEREVEVLQEIIGAARDLRAHMQLDPRPPVAGVIHARGLGPKRGTSSAGGIKELARVDLEIHQDGVPPAGGAVRSTHEFDLVLQVPQVQTAAHRKRLEKERDRLKVLIANAERQLSDETFMSRAPANVIETIRRNLSVNRIQLAKTEATLDGLSE